jgi:hypothetical protein
MPNTRRHASVLGPRPLRCTSGICSTLIRPPFSSLIVATKATKAPLVAYVAFVAAFFIRQTSAGRPPVLTFSTVAKLALWSTPRARSMRAALR